jgi:hypothetical protein
MIEATEPMHTPGPARPAEPYPYAQPGLPDPRRRRPILAMILSLAPGLGRVYCGYYRRGFIHAITVGVLITLLANQQPEPLMPLVGIFLGFFWLYNVVDAGRRAMLINEALAGRSEIELPSDFELPGPRGAIVGGVVLVAVGLVLLSNTWLGVSLDWLEQWWPAALVLFGGWLVYRAVQDRTRRPGPGTYTEGE